MRGFEANVTPSRTRLGLMALGTARMKRTARVRALAAACVLMTIAAGCSKAVAGQPVAGKLPQGVLSPHFTPEPDPLHVFKDGLFEPLVEPRPDNVRIPGYRLRIAPDGTTSKVSIQDYNPFERTWEPLHSPETVWSPTQAKWVTTERTETLSAGPKGSRDWPTIKSVADYGTSYYTVSVNELAGRPLAEGLAEGFSEGLKLPDSTRNVRFSPGARSYQTTTTLIGPIYLVTMVANAITRVPQYFHVDSCDPPIPDCQDVATSLEQVVNQGGRVQNFSGSAELEFDANGNATLHPVDSDIAFANLTYVLVKDDDPHRITLQAAHPDDGSEVRAGFRRPAEKFCAL